MAFIEPAAAGEAAEGSFYSPLARLHDKAFLALVQTDDLDGDGRGGANALAWYA